MLHMSQRDRDRLVVIRQVAEGRVPVVRGAELLELSRRQVYRIVARFEVEGDRAVVHRARGRPPNNAKGPELPAKVVEKARDPIYAGFGPTLLYEHLVRDPDLAGLEQVHATTCRLWLIQGGVWKSQRRGQRHRRARPRRQAVGELIQMDGSDHAWLEDRHPGRFCLLKMIDDATSRILMARFVPRENGPACRQLIVDYLRGHGRPVALYVDKAGHYGQKTRAYTPLVPLEEREAEPTESIIRRALSALNIGLILANSPQAKGRVERAFGTSQDRLVKELRVARVATLEEANVFLQERFIPFWNERFAREPADPRDRHRRLPKTADLDRLFAETEERTVAGDFTLRWRNRRFQIPKEQARGIRPGQKIIIESRLDRSIRFRFNNRYLEPEPIAPLPKREPRPKPAAKLEPKITLPPRPRPAPPRPGPDHPWRRPWLPARLQPSTPAASQPALSTPSAAGD